MVAGVGVDIIEVSRIKAAIERWGERFLKRIYTPHEVAYCRSLERPFESFAGRFAVKEACMKALGTGWADGVKWRSFEVKNDKLGKPYVIMDNELEKRVDGKKILVSISHTENYAAGVAVLSD